MHVPLPPTRSGVIPSMADISTANRTIFATLKILGRVDLDSFPTLNDGGFSWSLCATVRLDQAIHNPLLPISIGCQGGLLSQFRAPKSLRRKRQGARPWPLQQLGADMGRVEAPPFLKGPLFAESRLWRVVCLVTKPHHTSDRGR